jgi:hypothetical protein
MYNMGDSTDLSLGIGTLRTNWCYLNTTQDHKKVASRYRNHQHQLEGPRDCKQYSPSHHAPYR